MADNTGSSTDDRLAADRLAGDRRAEPRQAQAERFEDDRLQGGQVHEDRVQEDGDQDAQAEEADTNLAPGPERPRIANLVLNGVFLERLTPDQIAAYVDAIVAVADDWDRDDTALIADLQERLAGSGVVLAEQSYNNLASQIRSSEGRVAISTEAGTVLYGPSEVAVDEHDPSVRGTDDPEDSDRPFYS